MTLLDELEDKKLIFISGKGGVGKSLATVLLGIGLAKQGKKVLLAEQAVNPDLQKYVGLSLPPHIEQEVSPNLSVVNLTPQLCFKEYISEYLNMARLYSTVFDRSVVKSFLNALPGLREVMVLGRLYYTLNHKTEYDIILFDAPASGHFKSLLETPLGILESGFQGPLLDEIGKVASFIANKELCGLVLVTRPEKLVISETLEFLDNLSDKLELSGMIINRIYSKQQVQDLQIYKNKINSPEVDAILQQVEKQEITQSELLKTLKERRFDSELINFIPELPNLHLPMQNEAFDSLLRYLHKDL